ncbi:MAG: nitrate reductase [Robiginitomaculum sp.]|nr:MAG: nitrate reductase [Robiginitomaculum sp.]
MTDLLDFARGPALQFSLAVFVFGVVWRLVSLLFMPRLKDKSAIRSGAKPTMIAAVAEFFRRMLPKPEFAKRTRFTTINGWVFHLGLAIIVLTFAPHVLFIKSLTGLTWPALPNIVIFAVGGVTVVSLILALAHRLSSPVLKLISTMDDYVTWVVTITPVLTGLAAASHVGLRYETLLAIHILSICVFFVWFPFGKLMHGFLVFLTRGEMGAQLNRRGIKL